MTKTTLQFKSVTKDRLFYDRFKYCLGFTMAEANVLRGLNHRWIDARLDQRIEWRELARKRWNSSFEPQGWNEITTQIRADLHAVCQAITEFGCEYKLTVSTHSAWLYTNDPALIDHLRTFRCLTNKNYTQARVNRPKNTVVLKNSLYTNRSYMINVKLTTAEKETLKNFFTNQQEHVRISPSFRHWLYESPYYRLQDYYFVDHNGDTWLTMLGLVRPGLIRKRLEIITAK